MLWVAITIHAPLSFSSSNILCISFTPFSSNALVGSSNKIKSGFSKIACATFNLCLIPNEYLEKNESVVDVPLLGKVTAGTPIEAIETPDEFFSLPISLVNNKNEVFTLKVSGESMINVGIFDGDILIVEKRNTARNGETVVAMNSEGEATVKTFYKENGYFRLQPENDTMEPIILKEVTILGKVVGLYRKL